MHHKLLAVPLILRNFALREQSFSEFIILVVVVRGIDIEGALSKNYMYIYKGLKPWHGFPPVAVNERSPDGW
jgi:hypothetical protein